MIKLSALVSAMVAFNLRCRVRRMKSFSRQSINLRRVQSCCNKEQQRKNKEKMFTLRGSMTASKCKRTLRAKTVRLCVRLGRLNGTCVGLQKVSLCLKWMDLKIQLANSRYYLLV